MSPSPEHDPDSTELDIDGFPAQSSGERAAGRDLLEVVMTEFLAEQRKGEPANVERYARRYPHLADQIREIFPIVSAMEHWKVKKESEILKEQISQDKIVKTIGQCEIWRRLGSGGMGVVFEGYHHNLRKRVAVKLLPSRFSRDSAFRRRFEQEAKLASTLSHRNIVPVLEFGEQDGMCYYVMPFVESVSLEWIIRRLRETDGVVYAEEIREWHDHKRAQAENPADEKSVPQRLPPAASAVDEPGRAPAAAEIHGETVRKLKRDAWPQMARIALHVAEALRYAHAHGTIHRDIKPANLLLDSDGRVWITDFGLARPLEQNFSTIDDSGGTVRYMAPERFAGQCDVRSDLYSLGMTLFELFTLQPAFDLADKSALIDAICQRDPPLLRPLRRGIPRDLEAIVLKCLERDPEVRYQTAGELAGDLLRFLNHQPVKARRPSLWKRLHAWLGRTGRWISHR